MLVEAAATHIGTIAIGAAIMALGIVVLVFRRPVSQRSVRLQDVRRGYAPGPLKRLYPNVTPERWLVINSVIAAFLILIGAVNIAIALGS